LEIEMIHRTDRGDGIVPLDDLNRFAEAARLIDGEYGYSRALLTASTACRHSGRYQEGLSFVSRAVNHANANKRHARLFEISLAAVLLHIAAGQYSLGAEALAKTQKYSIGTDNNRFRNEIHYHAARLALEHGDLAEAETEFKSIDSPASTFSAARKGYYRALEIRIRLRRGDPAEVIAPLVFELEAYHLRTRASGSQDFEAHALHLGLCALGQSDRAARLLNEYVNNHRPRGWPLADGILRALGNTTPEGHSEAARPRAGFHA
jgi:tetratricopeptide (TPR) repeat protein